MIVVIGAAGCGRARSDEREASPSSTTSTVGAGAPGPADQTTTTTSAAPTDEAEARPSSGCTTGATAPAGTTTEHLVSGGESRTYLLDTPPGDATTPKPLVVDLHGLGSDAQQQASYSQLAARAAARGWIGVNPEAAGRARFWKVPPIPGDDVDFLSELIDTIAEGQCVDLERVYVAGISNGSAMAEAVSCGLADRLAGIAAVAGPNAYKPCTSAAPVAMIAFHGTDDPLIPFDGGSFFQGAPDSPGRKLGALGSGDGGLAKPATEAMDGWAARNGCDGGATSSTVTAAVQLLTYSGCTAGAELYVIEGGGHTWPGSTATAPEQLLGATTHDIDATALILDFFAGQAASA